MGHVQSECFQLIRKKKASEEVMVVRAAQGDHGRGYKRGSGRGQGIERGRARGTAKSMFFKVGGASVSIYL